MTALRRQLLWAGAGTALVTAALIIWVDIPMALFFEGHRETWWVGFFERITDFASGWIWYPVAVLASAQPMCATNAVFPIPPPSCARRAPGCL